jgi:CRP-like cAMP-binding protein
VRELTYARGETIFREGSFATTMYEILEGSVAIIASEGTPAERRLATLGAGEFFGEMGLVEYYPRSATVIAMEDGTRVRETAADEFSAFMREHPDKTLDIMRQINARLKDTTDRYFEAISCVYDAVESEDKGRRRDEGVRRGLGRMVKAFRRRSGRN